MSMALSENLSPQDILLNKVWLQGMIIYGVFYGIVVTLSFSCLHLLSVSRKTSQREPQSPHRQNRWLQIYVIFLLVFSTVDIALKGREAENAYMHHSNYPSGPAAFIIDNASAIPVARAVCFVFLQWASDGLLLWRCLMFFSDASFHVGWIQIIVVLLWCINAGLSTIFIIALAFPTYFGQSNYTLRLSYGFYTLSLNTAITLAIVARLLLHRRVMIKALGPNHGKFYLGVISVLTESAAVIVAYDLFYLVPAVIRFPLSRIGRQIGVMVQIIPPLMIIQRVAQGVDSVQQIRSSEVTLGIEFAQRRTENPSDGAITTVPIRSGSV